MGPSTQSDSTVHSPPRPRSPNGEIRRVGVEIEFTNLSPADAASILAEVLDGRARATDNPFVHEVEDRRWGVFTIELDTRWVRLEEPVVKMLRDLGLTDIEEVAELGREADIRLRDLIGNLSSGLVPTEIVTPPLPWSELGLLSPTIERLRQMGAKGTDENLLYGFGLHLNPELPSLETPYILSALRAYILLSEWLRRAIRVDPTREILPHIDPFPIDYALLILDADYQPDQARLIDDYLEHNPTRNRELDMLPLFTHLDSNRVAAQLEDDRIKPRPTFHYRLPNVTFTDPAWGVIAEWNRWLQVEELAESPEEIQRLAAGYREFHQGGTWREWWDDLNAWLND